MLCIALTACRDDDGPDTANLVVSDLATFVGNNVTGAVFTVRQVDDLPEATLQSPSALDTAKVAPGSRVFISYRPANGLAYSTTDITLRQVALITSSAVVTAPIDSLPGWDADGVYLLSIWRTGHWLNVYARLAYDEQPRTYALVADEATLGDPVPQLYLAHTLASEVNTFDRRYYASFDISEVWQRSDIEGVDVHVANTNLTSSTLFEFRKN